MNKRISLIVQEKTILSYFPDSVVRRYRERELTWVYTIVPSEVSASYRIKLHCRNDHPRVFVVEPAPLELAKGKTKLPHVYSTSTQQLCLYYPLWREWHPGKLFVHTLIPWTSEWLQHYEVWVATGTWCGGGIEHENAAEV